MDVWETPGQNLRSQLTRVKSTKPGHLQSDGVYILPCSCGRCYIGQTKRQLRTRLKEHKNNIRYARINSVTDHWLTCNKGFTWNGARFIDRGRNTESRLIKETIAIRHHRALNKLVEQNDSMELHASWNDIIKEKITY